MDENQREQRCMRLNELLQPFVEAIKQRKNRNTEPRIKRIYET